MNNSHKRYEVSCRGANGMNACSKEFDTYVEVIDYLKTIPKDNYETILVQELVSLYVNGKLVY